MQLNLPSLGPASAAAPAAKAAPEAFTWAKFTDVAGDFAVNLSLAVLILIATWFAARWASRLVAQAIGKLRFSRKDPTLKEFARELTRWVVVIVGMVAVLQRLGVQTASIIAVLGAASLAIGLALQGALSNVAAGVLLLLLRPYRVGDEVEIAGQAGKVRRLDLFTTDIATYDNRRVVVPNAKVTGDLLINYTAHHTRRVEVDVDVGAGCDLDRVLELMTRVAGEHPSVLSTPAPWAGVAALKDWSVLVRLRVWTKTADWSQTQFDLRKQLKQRFDREGVEIPFPTQVALTKVEQAGPAHGGEPAPAEARSFLSRPEA